MLLLVYVSFLLLDDITCRYLLVKLEAETTPIEGSYRQLHSLIRTSTRGNINKKFEADTKPVNRGYRILPLYAGPRTGGNINKKIEAENKPVNKGYRVLPLFSDRGGNKH